MLLNIQNKLFGCCVCHKKYLHLNSINQLNISIMNTVIIIAVILTCIVFLIAGLLALCDGSKQKY